jgi:hypothetical protein
MQTKPSQGPSPEAERQLAAAAERHGEVVASMHEQGRPETGQHAAVKAVGRAAELVSFALRHAAESGVPVERLAELTGWDPRLVEAELARPPEPGLVERLMPPGLDPRAVERAAASIEAHAQLHALTQRILADVDDDAWSPAAGDLVDLHEHLEGAWRTWRQALGRGTPRTDTAEKEHAR